MASGSVEVRNSSGVWTVIRAAAKHDYPTANINTMLAEIERGYATGMHP